MILMVCVAFRVLSHLHSPCYLISKDTRVKQSLGLVSGLRKATAPADFSTQQVWIVMSGRAHSSLWCKPISFVFPHRGALFFSFPLLSQCLDNTNETYCTAVSQRDGCWGEYCVVGHCLEEGGCKQQQTSVYLLYELAINIACREVPLRNWVLLLLCHWLQYWHCLSCSQLWNVFKYSNLQEFWASLNYTVIPISFSIVSGC